MAGRQPEHRQTTTILKVKIKEDIPCLNKVRKAFEVVDLFLVPHLFIQYYQLSFYVSSLCKFSIKLFLNLGSFYFLDFRGVLFQLLTHFLKHLSLLFQLNNN